MTKKSVKAAAREMRPRYKTFFAAWRSFRDLTQDQVAERMGTNKIRVSLKERDQEAWDMDYLEALSKALKVDKYALLLQDPYNLDDSPEGEVWRLLDDLPEDAKEKAIDYMRTLKIASKAAGR